MNKKKVVKTIISIFLVAVIIFSLYNLIVIIKDYINISNADEYLQSEFIISDDSDENVQNKDKSKNRGGLKINWSKLIKCNSDVIAWIYIPDTHINYPILQGDFNEEYLSRDIHKNYLKSGSIFADSSNKRPFVDFNTIIYGHNLMNSSMFSDLEKYSKLTFADAHPNVYIYTPDGKCSEYKVFSFYKVNAADDKVYNTDVDNKTEYVKSAKEHSNIESDIDESKISNIITLSTCTNIDYDERYVLHAVKTQ